MKRIRIAIILLFALVNTFANPISKEQALQKAISFMTERGMKTDDITVARTAPRQTPSGTTTKGEAAYYVFNAAEESGFVIVSGDDRTESILGYSDKGSFDENTMPRHVKAWLDDYAEQLEAIDKNAATPARVTEKRQAIAPLLKTQWDQDAPFNNKLPKYYGQTCVVGCVATAAAQIMYYHRWPQGETTSIPAYTTETTKTFIPFLSPTIFEWDKMPLKKNGKDTDDACAKLNLYVSQAVKTDYGTQFSAATLNDIHSALMDYFGYNKNIKHIRRDTYSIDDWHDIVYNELSNGRPVFYAGESSGGAHAFVCDGYDDGLFHINWGWSGAYDGFFRLELLNPTGSGLGGSTTAGGYTLQQQCLIDIKPSEGEQRGALYLSAKDLKSSSSTASYSIYNDNTITTSFNFGWGLIDDAGNVTNVLENHYAKDLPPSYGYRGVECRLKNLSLPAGTHKLVPISKEYSSSTWKSAVASLAYIEVTADAKGFVSAVQHPIKNITATSFEWERIPMVNKSYGVSVTLKNDGEEFNGPLYVFVSNGFTSWGKYVDYEGAFVKAGTTDVVTFHPQFKSSGTYRVMLSTDSQGTTVIGETTVDVMPQPTGKINIKLESITYTQSGSTLTYRAIVTNKATEQYVNGLRFNFYGGPSSLQQVPYISSYSYNDIIEPGQTSTITFSFDGLKTGNSYAVLVLAYENVTGGTTELGMSDWLDVTNTGINDITVDNDTAPYYTIQGMKIDKPKQNGLYIHNGKKIIFKGR